MFVATENGVVIIKVADFNKVYDFRFTLQDLINKSDDSIKQ